MGLPGTILRIGRGLGDHIAVAPNVSAGSLRSAIAQAGQPLRDGPPLTLLASHKLETLLWAS